MAIRRLTLRITSATDVAKAVSQIEAELAVQGIANSALTDLVLETANRFQKNLLESADASAESIMRGEGYTIRVTTRTETAIEKLLNRLRRRPASFS